MLSYVTAHALYNNFRCAPVQVVSEKLDRFQAEIDAVPPTEAERYENLLRRMRYSLHDNHYLITDTKRRLIGPFQQKPKTLRQTFWDFLSFGLFSPLKGTVT